jgi:hypothetical protein
MTNKRVVVLGPFPPQLDLVCVTYAQRNIENKLQGSDLVIGMTSFMRHSTDGAAIRCMGSAYRKTTGSVSSVKRLINSWLEETKNESIPAVAVSDRRGSDRHVHHAR